MADILRRHVDEQIAGMSGPDGFWEDGMHHTAFTIKEHFHVLDNGDLYVDDDYSEEITGMLLQGLRGQHYLVENAEIIVPKVYKKATTPAPVFLRDADDGNDDNIVRYEDMLPDSAFDDGHFEEEMEEIERGKWDDEE